METVNNSLKRPLNNIYQYLVKTWLVSILVILPFQMKIADCLSNWSIKLSTLFHYLDEFTVIFFLVLSIGEFYKKKALLNRSFLFLLTPLVLFAVSGLAAGFKNGNSLSITLLGTFDYIKNFLVIFIYAAFFRDFHEFKKIFRLLLLVALLLGAVALIEFLWAMGSVYILGKNIADPTAYFLFKLPSDNITTLRMFYWRFGIFSTSSLTNHTYTLGLYCLLIVTIYLYVAKRARIALLILLFSGSIASVSRMVYAGLLFVISIRAYNKGKRWAVLLLLIIVLAGALLINYDGPDLDLLDLSKGSIINNTDQNPIRPYTRYKALEIWKDHPIWGVGPGMFGGIVASKYRSYIYDEYNVLNQNYIFKVGNIEQFWFQIMPETGIIGTLIFGSFFIMLLIFIRKLRKQTNNEETRGLLSALYLFVFCILFYSIGSGINIAPVLFTFCALVGIGAGYIQNESEKN